MPALVPYMDSREVGVKGPRAWEAKKEGTLQSVYSAVCYKLSFMLKDDPIFRIGSAERLQSGLTRFLYDYSSDAKVKTG